MKVVAVTFPDESEGETDVFVRRPPGYCHGPLKYPDAPRVVISGTGDPVWRDAFLGLIGKLGPADKDVVVFDPRRPTSEKGYAAGHFYGWEFSAFMASDLACFWFAEGTPCHASAFLQYGYWSSYTKHRDMGERPYSLFVGCNPLSPVRHDVEAFTGVTGVESYVYDSLSNVADAVVAECVAIYEEGDETPEDG